MKRGRWRAVLWIGFMTAMLCLGILFTMSERVSAAKKSKISWSVKNGTLTFRGKGEIPRQIKVADKKKITKIVVKHGITSVRANAFRGFKNVKEVIIAGSVSEIGDYALPDSKVLKKVTLPGSFYCAPDFGTDVIANSIIPNENMRIDTICFNTQLSLETLSYVKSSHLIVAKGDKKYKSIKGVIYSKDGKSIVRVPAFRKSLTVEKGCEEFCTQAVLYGSEYEIMDIDTDYRLVCKDLKKIWLPASIRSVNTKKYYAVCDEASNVESIVASADQMEGEALSSILKSFPHVDTNRFLKQFPDVSTQNGMYINGWDGTLLRYTGKADEITIPDRVNKIVAYAFQENGVKRVVIPDSVTEIGDYAFSDCRKLQEIRLPDTMKKMGTYVFCYCSILKSVHFPNGLSKVPDYTFWGCTLLEEVTLPNSVTTIGTGAFGYTKVPHSILLLGNIKT